MKTSPVFVAIDPSAYTEGILIWALGLVGGTYTDQRPWGTHLLIEYLGFKLSDPGGLTCGLNT